MFNIFGYKSKPQEAKDKNLSNEQSNNNKNAESQNTEEKCKFVFIFQDDSFVETQMVNFDVKAEISKRNWKIFNEKVTRIAQMQVEGHKRNKVFANAEEFIFRVFYCDLEKEFVLLSNQDDFLEAVKFWEMSIVSIPPKIQIKIYKTKQAQIPAMKNVEEEKKPQNLIHPGPVSQNQGDFLLDVKKYDWMSQSLMGPSPMSNNKPALEDEDANAMSDFVDIDKTDSAVEPQQQQKKNPLMVSAFTSIFGGLKNKTVVNKNENVANVPQNEESLKNEQSNQNPQQSKQQPSIPSNSMEFASSSSYSSPRVLPQQSQQDPKKSTLPKLFSFPFFNKGNNPQPANPPPPAQQQPVMMEEASMNVEENASFEGELTKKSFADHMAKFRGRNP